MDTLRTALENSCSLAPFPFPFPGSMANRRAVLGTELVRRLEVLEVFTSAIGVGTPKGRLDKASQNAVWWHRFRFPEKDSGKALVKGDRQGSVAVCPLPSQDRCGGRL